MNVCSSKSSVLAVFVRVHVYRFIFQVEARRTLKPHDLASLVHARSC